MENGVGKKKSKVKHVESLPNQWAKKNVFESIHIYTQVAARSLLCSRKQKKRFDVYSFYYYIRPPVPDENVARQTIAIVLLRHRNNRMESASAF